MPGCTDTAKPKKSTPEELSRIKDALDAAALVSKEAERALWHSIPYDVRVEFNSFNWSYVPSVKDPKRTR